MGALQDAYMAGAALGGVGGLLGGVAAVRTRSHRRELDATQAGWSRLVDAVMAENKTLRRECGLLRQALRRALERVKELS